MKKLTLCFMSAFFLLHPFISLCGKHKYPKKNTKIRYGIIKTPQGISVLYVANLTNDEMNESQPAINQIAKIDDLISECEKKSEQKSKLKKQIAVIEKRYNLRRLSSKNN